MDNKASSFKQILAEMARRREARRARREARLASEAILMDTQHPQQEKWCYTCQATTQSLSLCRTRFHHIETETILAAHQCRNNDATSCTKRGTHLGVIGGRSSQANDASHEAAQEQRMMDDQFRR